MSRALNAAQAALLAATAGHGLIPVTLRTLSDLRWLEYLGLVRAETGGCYVLTDAGRIQLLYQQRDARKAG